MSTPLPELPEELLHIIVKLAWWGEKTRPYGLLVTCRLFRKWALHLFYQSITLDNNDLEAEESEESGEKFIQYLKRLGDGPFGSIIRKPTKLTLYLEVSEYRPVLFVPTRRISFATHRFRTSKAAKFINICPNIEELYSMSQDVHVDDLARVSLKRLSSSSNISYLFDLIKLSPKRLPLAKSLTHLDIINGKPNVKPSDIAPFESLTHFAFQVDWSDPRMTEVAVEMLTGLLRRKQPDYPTIKAIIVWHAHTDSQEPAQPANRPVRDLRVVEMDIKTYDIANEDRMWLDGTPDVWERADGIIAQRIQNANTVHR